MSSSSAQFRSRVFLHSIPLCVQLPDSLRSTAEIHSVYISARGISYPPLVVAQVLALLNVASSSAEQRYQITCNGERIRDSHPISVLASLHPSDSPLQLKLIPAPDGTMPEGSVPGVPYNLQESCRQSYQSLLKASDALRFGSTRRTTSLSRDETLSLFDMIQSQSLQVVEFWKVFSRLIDPPPAGSNEKWSKVGCCFYLPQGSEVSMDGPLICKCLQVKSMLFRRS